MNSRRKQHLTVTETRIVTFLLERQAGGASLLQLCDAIYPGQLAKGIAADRRIKVYVSRLRRKLGVAGFRVAHVRGGPYRVEAVW